MPATRDSKRGSPNVAGPPRALASFTQNREPCQGHWISQRSLPTNLPSLSGPPACVQVFPITYTEPSSETMKRSTPLFVFATTGLRSSSDAAVTSVGSHFSGTSLQAWR